MYHIFEGAVGVKLVLYFKNYVKLLPRGAKNVQKTLKPIRYNLYNYNHLLGSKKITCEEIRK